MKIYFVKPGDTISSIAARYGVEEGALLRLNGLEPGETLAPGSKLKIPVLSAAADLRAESKPQDKKQDKKQDHKLDMKQVLKHVIKKETKQDAKQDKKESLTAEKQVQQPVQKQVQQPVQQVQKQVQQPVQKPVQQPVQKPAQQPAQIVVPVQKPPEKQPAKDLFQQQHIPALEAGSFYDWPNMASDAANAEAGGHALNAAYEAGQFTPGAYAAGAQQPQAPWGMPYPQMNAMLQYQAMPYESSSSNAQASASNIQASAGNVQSTAANIQSAAGNFPSAAANVQSAAQQPTANVQAAAGQAAYPLAAPGMLPAKPCGCGSKANVKSAGFGPAQVMGNMMPNVLPGMTPNVLPGALPNVLPGMTPNVLPAALPNVLPSMPPNMMPGMTANMAMPYPGAWTMPGMNAPMGYSGVLPSANVQSASAQEPKAKLHEAAPQLFPGDDPEEDSANPQKSKAAAGRTAKKARSKPAARRDQSAVARTASLNRQTKRSGAKSGSNVKPWIQHPLG